MNEDVLNISLRKFLKKVGVTSQREIEPPSGPRSTTKKLAGSEKLPAAVRLTIPQIGLDVTIDGTIELA